MRITKKTKIGFKFIYAAIFSLITVIKGAPTPKITNNDSDIRTLESDNTDIHSSDHLKDKRVPPLPKWIFGYENHNGPQVWHQTYEKCGGNRQSPINLDTTSSITSYHPRLFWWNYNLKPKEMIVKNNGHTVMLLGEWEDSNLTPYYWHSNGNPTEEYYEFHHLHFHWGVNNSEGSEHTINDQKYPLEMHAVHFKRTLTTIEGALQDPNGLRVVSLLFTLSENENLALRPIVSVLKNVRQEGTAVKIEPFEIRKLLPEFSNFFLTYNGSLTAPPCAENVNWVVKVAPSTVSAEQLAEFRKLFGEEGHTLTHNYRPVQPINGRLVYHIR